jgi:hypothetical protein
MTELQPKMEIDGDELEDGKEEADMEEVRRRIKPRRPVTMSTRCTPAMGSPS